MSSKNLMEKLSHLTPIEDWFERSAHSQYGLQQVFNSALEPNSLFHNIYVAVRHNPQNTTEAETETWNYYNVGRTAQEIAAYFAVRYGLNYFAYNPDVTDDAAKLVYRIREIYETNEYKYRKLIEVMGYQYNPIWNVDGTELYANAESLGDSTSTRIPTGQIKTENNPTSIHYVNPYDEDDADDMKVESKDTVTGNSTIQSFENPDPEHPSVDTQYRDATDIKHKPAWSYKWDGTQSKWVEDAPFSVLAKDNAFGVAFTGPERFYAEKRIRSGNIGVTMTQQLLEAQRKLVNYNLIDEFFKDLEPHIVVGLY